MGNLTDLQQYLVDEFVEDYQEGHLSRRDALRRLAAGTGSLILASTSLAACGPAEGGNTGAAPTAAGAATTAAPVETMAAPGATTATAATTPSATETTAAAEATAAAAAGVASGAEATSTAAAGPNVAPDDPAIRAEPVQFPGQRATLMGYLARPSGNGSFPIVLVCHVIGASRSTSRMSPAGWRRPAPQHWPSTFCRARAVRTRSPTLQRYPASSAIPRPISSSKTFAVA